MEGGYDGPHQPATCFTPTIALGRHPGPGAGDGLWRDYERVLDLVPSLGLDGVRLTVEWARVEPRRGLVDEEALERYRAVCAYARSLHLDVTVALFDQTWPAWLGLEAWLLPWVFAPAVAHALRVVSTLREVITGVVVFTNRDALVIPGFVNATAPPWRLKALDDARSALAQLERIERTLQAQHAVAPLLVGARATIRVDQSPFEILAQLAALGHCREIYLRALVQGSGPTAASGGLLVRNAHEWTSQMSPELLGAWG